MTNHSSPVTAELDSVYDALVQAQDCIRGETPEDITDAEAREDTINKVREAMRQVEAMRRPAQQPASPVTDTAAALIEAGDDLYSAFSDCAETKFQIEAMTNYANASNAYYGPGAPAQQPASPVKETDLLARLRDFVAAESKRWVNCGTGELERIEVSPAGKLAQEAIEALARHAQCAPWQPIETAPKDGTVILVLCDWEPCTAVAFYQAGEWLVRWDHSRFEGGYEATHWTPLPGPPSTVTSHNSQQGE